MAICLAGMFGRLGSASGGNITALLLDYHCESVFYLFGSSILGNFLMLVSNSYNLIGNLSTLIS